MTGAAYAVKVLVNKGRRVVVMEGERKGRRGIEKAREIERERETLFVCHNACNWTFFRS